MEKHISVVTGANGFVGSNLVDLLLEKGHIVRCIVRKTSDLKWLKDKNVEIYDCGLFDEEALSNAFEGANYIFHVAGVVKSKKPEGYFKGNVEATKHVLETALKAKDSIKKVVIVSSQTAVGPSLKDQPVNEETIPHPITTYGKSKLAEEELAKQYMNKLPIVICRAPAVYGERDTEIFIFFNTYKKGLFTTIGWKDKTLSLIHVIDLVNGFYLAAINENSAGKIYFISSEKFYTWSEVGKICEKVFNKKALHIKIPHFVVYLVAAIAEFFSLFSSKAATLNLEKARDIVQEYWTCDTSKAVKELGYKQNISLEEGIQRTVDWYKQMKWL